MKTMKLTVIYRISLTLLALLLCLGYVSCTSTLDEDAAEDFDVSYEVPEQTEIARGEKITVLMQATNISETTYSYKSCQHDDPFYATIYCVTEDGEYRLEPEPEGATGDQCRTVRYTVAPGETRQRSIGFKVPEDAPLGSYHLRVSYRGIVRVFENAYTVVRNDNELLEAKKGDFAFSYEIAEPQDNYHRGDTVEIKAKITNQSDRTFYYQGTGAVPVCVSLYSGAEGCEVYLLGTSAPTEQELHECQFAPGATDEVVWTFEIPNDAPRGSYCVRVYYQYWGESYSAVLTVSE